MQKYFFFSNCFLFSRRVKKNLRVFLTKPTRLCVLYLGLFFLNFSLIEFTLTSFKYKAHTWLVFGNFKNNFYF